MPGGPKSGVHYSVPHCSESIRVIKRQAGNQANDEEDDASEVNPAIVVLLDGLDHEEAHSLAWESASRIGAGRDSYDLDRVLFDGSREVWQGREKEASEADDWDVAEMILTAPLPCRLTTQELVELLKMPTCLGENRRAVLDHLGRRYGQRFANHWEFVRFAEDKGGMGLDFKTPPKRPERRTR